MAKGDWLGEFEFFVMIAVARLGDDAYGIRVRQMIETNTGRAVSIGAVYTTLGRLEDKGLIRFRLTDPQPVAGGRARKVFRVTAEGARTVRQAAAMLKQMMLGWNPAGLR
jgi:DNA-binding PadR family transcriptional regulator